MFRTLAVVAAFFVAIGTATRTAEKRLQKRLDTLANGYNVHNSSDVLAKPMQVSSRLSAEHRLKVVDALPTVGVQGVSHYNLGLHQNLRHLFEFHTVATFGGPLAEKFASADGRDVMYTKDWESNRPGQVQTDSCYNEVSKVGPDTVLATTVKQVFLVKKILDAREQARNISHGPRIVWAFHFMWTCEKLLPASSWEPSLADYEGFNGTVVMNAYARMTERDSIVYASPSCKEFYERDWFNAGKLGEVGLSMPTPGPNVVVIPPYADHAQIEKATLGLTRLAFNTAKPGPQLIHEGGKLEIMENVDVVFAQAGVICEMKNQLTTVKAVAKWFTNKKKEKPDLKAQLILIGFPAGLRVNMAEYEIMLKAEIWVNALMDGLTISQVPMQQQGDVWRVLSLADIFIFPTKNEVFGMMPIEVMSAKSEAGPPITIVSGGQDKGFPGSLDGFVQDGVSGFTFDRDDDPEEAATSLALKIGAAFDLLGTSAKRNITEAGSRAVSAYSVEEFQRKWCAVIRGEECEL